MVESVWHKLYIQESVQVANSSIGVTCQSWMHGELFLHCYAIQSPVEDVLHCVCKNAYLVGYIDTSGMLIN